MKELFDDMARDPRNHRSSEDEVHHHNENDNNSGTKSHQQSEFVLRSTFQLHSGIRIEIPNFDGEGIDLCCMDTGTVPIPNTNTST